MGASVVTYAVDAANAEELTARVREHVVPAARGADGYRGFLLLDQGDGKRLAVLLFDDVAQVGPAQQIIGPVGRDQTYHLMSGPAIGSVCPVLVADGAFGEPA